MSHDEDLHVVVSIDIVDELFTNANKNFAPFDLSISIALKKRREI